MVEGTESWQRIVRYALGECTAEEAVETRAWIDADPGRRALAEELIRIADAGPQPIFDSGRAWQRLREELPALQPEVVAEPLSLERTHRKRSGRRMLLAASIASLLLAGSAVVWREMRSIPSSARIAIEDLRTISTQPRQTADVFLADGTRVRLGPSSTIRFAEQFGRTRDVWLEGVAYFEVAEEQRGLLRRERPFAVRTEHGVIRDIGTSFSVRSWPGSGTTDVVVAEGLVALSQQDLAPRETPDSLLLGAGDMGRLDRTGSLTIERDVDVAALHAWMQDRLVFTDSPITEVIEQFRHWYGIDLQLGDASLSDAHVTATFDLRSATDALELLATILDARTVRTDSAVILYHRSRR